MTFTNLTVAHVNVICPKQFASVCETARKMSCISCTIHIQVDEADRSDFKADAVSCLDNSKDEGRTARTDGSQYLEIHKFGYAETSLGGSERGC